MAELEPLPFESDKSGAVHNIVGMEIAESNGNDFFEWTITRVGYVSQIAVFPAYEAEIIEFTMSGKRPDRVPAPQFKNTIRWYLPGHLCQVGTKLRIVVRSPVGTRVRGYLWLAWLSD